MFALFCVKKVKKINKLNQSSSDKLFSVESRRNEPRASLKMLIELLLGICGDVTSGREPDSYFFVGIWERKFSCGGDGGELGRNLEEQRSAAEPRGCASVPRSRDRAGGGLWR